MKKKNQDFIVSIVETFKIDGGLSFKPVGDNLKTLGDKLLKLVGDESSHENVCNQLQKKWNVITSCSKEYLCFEEINDKLIPKHVEAGREIPVPCVFILDCGCKRKDDDKEIYLRLKINYTAQGGEECKYEVSELFFCDENGASLLGFLQMPFYIEGLRYLISDLKKHSEDKQSIGKFKDKVSESVYKSWIKQGMPTNKAELSFETGLTRVRDNTSINVKLSRSGEDGESPYRYDIVFEQRNNIDERWAPLEKVTVLNQVNGGDTDSVDDDPSMKHGQKPEENDNTSDGLGQVTDDTATEDILPKAEMTIKSRGDEESNSDEKAIDKMTVSKDGVGFQSAPNHLENTTPITPNSGFIEKTDDGKPDGSSMEKSQTHSVDDEESAKKTEREFLDRFKKYVKDCGFNYDDSDLERFHTCVKTGMMTLLGGDPGSGKSSLFELYARALAGKSGERNFKRVDVNPTWMEPSDLMGYSTPNVNDPKGGMRFHESQCGLRRFLAELGNQSERAPALVCFEEMNLARIELYFAEFIQAISRYEISAEDKQLPSYGGNGTEGELAIPADIRFVGTCNEDPTVKPMSDRFLDRSNVIRLSGNNKAWKKTEEKDSAGKDEGQPEKEERKKLNSAEEKFCLFARKSGQIGECSSDRVSAKNFVKWVKKPSQEDIQKVGAELDDILNPIRKELSAIVACPGQRVVGEILRYVANRPFPPGVTDAKVRLYVAFDEALVQRVISKCVPNALMRGKFKAAADKVRETFAKGFSSEEEKKDKSGAEETIVSLTAERLEELEEETKSLFQWGGVEDDSNVGNME